MHEGRIIYQGLRDDVLIYFKQLGYFLLLQKKAGCDSKFLVLHAPDQVY